MANIGKWPGRLHFVSLADSGAVVRDISKDVKTVQAPSSAQSHDVSGGGDAIKVYVVGQKDQTVQIDGPWNSTALTGVHAVLAGVVGGTTSLPFAYGPAGSVTGYPKFAGNVYCSVYDVHSDVAAAVTYRATLIVADSAGLAWGVF